MNICKMGEYNPKKVIFIKKLFLLFKGYYSLRDTYRYHNITEGRTDCN